MTISFDTQRLKVEEISGELRWTDQSVLLEKIPSILTSLVVENLPPYLHDITSSESAEIWLDRMLLESRLLQVKSKQHELIGFLFAYVENGSDAHIGYLLSKENWGKGLASELLQSFIEEVAKTEPWSKLIGGVEKANVVSANLLKKLGFVEQPINENSVVFYEYTISRQPS
ncbi:GNAT family N-acetyltransferase [Marinomonas sp. 15G1-11]|uniref:GNAT family N-acetyltransferase n=1 Tax=Marinomonas phaeophyticola TaxID=3004091 RepID=A0ABT4JT42_9GAMM|nr:GNAT family N-acetyltransferase [Marinomonas sp. 15G1-11]MCZ2721570.1 GNAT family N-acetyltransferase [Marinomonas sp. 15G1-11]